MNNLREILCEELTKGGVPWHKESICAIMDGQSNEQLKSKLPVLETMIEKITERVIQDDIALKRKIAIFKAIKRFLRESKK